MKIIFTIYLLAVLGLGVWFAYALLNYIRTPKSEVKERDKAFTVFIIAMIIMICVLFFGGTILIVAWIFTDAMLHM